MFMTNYGSRMRALCLLAAVGACDGEKSEEPLAACVDYGKSGAADDLDACAEVLMPACEALTSAEACEAFAPIAGDGVEVRCAWSSRFVGSAACEGAQAPVCLAARYLGEGGPSCAERADHYVDRGDGTVAAVDAPCGFVLMRHASCFAGDSPAACACLD
jgi:hypothetical protein